jgi:hypothetical protein
LIALRPERASGRHIAIQRCRRRSSFIASQASNGSTDTSLDLDPSGRMQKCPEFTCVSRRSLTLYLDSSTPGFCLCWGMVRSGWCHGCSKQNPRINVCLLDNRAELAMLRRRCMSSGSKKRNGVGRTSFHRIVLHQIFPTNRPCWELPTPIRKAPNFPSTQWQSTASIWGLDQLTALNTDRRSCRS